MSNLDRIPRDLNWTADDGAHETIPIGKIIAEQRAQIARLSGANAKLREILGVAYAAMKSAIGRCQATVDESLAEHPAVKAKRHAIFGDLDIPLARVGCTIRASDEALAEVDQRMADALHKV